MYITTIDICFFTVNILFTGSTNDSFIWHNSSVYRRFADGEFGNYLLLGVCMRIYVFHPWENAVNLLYLIYIMLHATVCYNNLQILQVTAVTH